MRLFTSCRYARLKEREGGRSCSSTVHYEAHSLHLLLRRPVAQLHPPLCTCLGACKINSGHVGLEELLQDEGLVREQLGVHGVEEVEASRKEDLARYGEAPLVDDHLVLCWTPRGVEIPAGQGVERSSLIKKNRSLKISSYFYFFLLLT